jgi:hypothetical protein
MAPVLLITELMKEILLHHIARLLKFQWLDG